MPRSAMLRLLAAAVGVAALIGRFVYGQGFITFSVGNYFGYLTHQSNIAAVGDVRRRGSADARAASGSRNG